MGLWFKDLAEVLVTVGVLIVVFRLAFGSLTLVPLVVVTSESMVHPTDPWLLWMSDTDDSWRKWLSMQGISNETIEGLPFKNGFLMGDMIVTYSPGKYHVFSDTKLGDVVIYDRDNKFIHATQSRDPIIHRIVGVVQVQDWQVTNFTGTMDCFKLADFSEYIGYVKKCADETGECLYPRYPTGGTFRFFITKGDNNAGTDQCGFGGGIALPVNEEQLIARGGMRLPYIGWVKLVFNFLLRILFFWL